MLHYFLSAITSSNMTLQLRASFPAVSLPQTSPMPPDSYYGSTILTTVPQRTTGLLPLITRQRPSTHYYQQRMQKCLTTTPPITHRRIQTRRTHCHGHGNTAPSSAISKTQTSRIQITWSHASIMSRAKSATTVKTSSPMPPLCRTSVPSIRFMADGR